MRLCNRKNIIMSYHAGDDPDVVQPWFLWKRTWIIAAILLSLLAAGVGIFTYLGWKKIPEVGGGIIIEADEGTRIYFGDRLMVSETEPSAKIYTFWSELLGDEKHKGDAVELPDAAA